MEFKRLWMVLSTCLLLVALSGCGGSDDDDTAVSSSSLPPQPERATRSKQVLNTIHSLLNSIATSERRE